MTTLEPETLAIIDGKPTPSSRLSVIVGVATLVASMVGNVVQWRTNTAEAEKSRAEASQLRQEADKTAAEVQKLKQDQAESGERSVQSWLEELKKFDAPEDRAMVLSAAISTTSDERVKNWAREQLKLVEQALAERRRIAEAQLAIAENAARTPTGTPGNVTTSNPATSTGGGNAGSVAPSAASPAVTKDPKVAARVLATRDLSRITRAEAMIKNAK